MEGDRPSLGSPQRAAEIVALAPVEKAGSRASAHYEVNWYTSGASVAFLFKLIDSEFKWIPE